MSLLVDYVQPLTNWLQQNPHWSLLITFLVSLAESLAIIGSIVPGSVTMTAIGILAGSGIMRVDLTLLAAILGAVVGDSLSYILGYVYSERLVEIWPFKKYPQWLQYGKDFFAVHGGKSVLVGRFIGPLRSIIPVIAGILHMKHWRFFIANVLSAIGWAFLYVMPGVVIGAASHELSAESATRLFLLILIVLAGIWALSLVIKWLVIKLRFFFRKYLHVFWQQFRMRPVVGKLYKAITPAKERNHHTTAAFALITFFCILSFVLLWSLTYQATWISQVNLPVRLFLQSFHTSVLEAFFIFCTQLTTHITIAALFILCCFWFIYQRNSHAIIYLGSLILTTYLLGFLLKQITPSPRPQGLLVTMYGSSFPDIQLMVATAFYGFILFYINSVYSLFTHALRTFVFTLLALSGFGALYLGDYWLSDVLAAYLAGAALCLSWCLTYRKRVTHALKASNAPLMIFSFFAIMFLVTSIFTYFNFHKLSYNHTPYRKEFTLSEVAWWEQKAPALPLYRLNRIGKRIGLLNIEYSGELETLEKSLQANGWVTQTESFLTNLLTWISNQANGVRLPLLTQLYENRAPSLIMTYTDQRSKLNLELRVWESNYNLLEPDRFLWIGSLHPIAPLNRKTANNPGYFPQLLDPLIYLFPKENLFEVKKLTLPQEMVKTSSHPTQPVIVLIKEKQPKE